jgi:alkylated DNA repair dioxygenase AlkB
MTSPVVYIPDIIPDASAWFQALSTELAWERRPDAPRSEYWETTFGKPYTYGRGRGERTYHPKPSHPIIQTGRDMLTVSTGHLLQGCFLNMYGSARDWLGWHEDDDPGIDHTKPIAVITLGQGRIIQFRERLEPATETTKAVYSEPESLMLEHGSILLMSPGMQHTHQHRIPKASHEVKPRISMTYRGLIGGES